MKKLTWFYRIALGFVCVTSCISLFLLLSGCAELPPDVQRVSSLKLAAECGADAVKRCIVFGDHAPVEYRLRKTP